MPLPPPPPSPLDHEPVWAVHWYPRGAPSYPVTRDLLTRPDALQVAAGVDRTAQSRGWEGRTDVVLAL